MRSQTLPDGMTWEDCRKCGGLNIITPSPSVNGGTYGHCFECMKTALSDAEKTTDALRTYVSRLEADLGEERMFSETLVNVAEEEALGWEKHLSTDTTRSMAARAETCRSLAKSLRARLAGRIERRADLSQKPER